MAQSARFPIRFSRFNRVLFRLLLVPPSRARVDLDGDNLRVHMGWAFSARIPRRLVAKAGPGRAPFIRFTAGAHWWGGRWLVNGAPDGIVDIELSEPARAFAIIVPVRLRVLSVSLEDPDGFLAALGAPPA